MKKLQGKLPAKRNRNNKWMHGLIALLCSAAIFIFSYFDWLYRFDNVVSDAIYQEEQMLDGRIVVLGIDSRALEYFGKFETWDRSIYADLIDALNANPEARPAAIGIDIMFYGETREESDARLAEAAGRYGNVIVGSSVNFKNEIIENEDGSFYVNPMGIDLYEEPYDELKAVTRQALVNMMPDEDGIIRSNTLFVDLPDGRRIHSFGYELYRMYAEKNGLPVEAAPPMNDDHQWYIPFYAKPGGYNDNFSILDVLTGDLPPEFFADSIVLIGPYATGMRDSYLTAIDHTVLMNGVEIHANIADALLNGDYKAHASPLLQSLIFAVITFFAYFAFKRLKPKFSTPLMLLLAAGYLAAAYFLGGRGYLLKVVYLPVMIFLLYLSWIAAGYTMEFLEKKRLTDSFKKYVAPQVVDEVIRSMSSISLGGSKKEIACLFVDIRGFTPMSEALAPEQVVEVLNEYLDLTCRSIFAHNGTLDKFIGDATMAIFNAPIDLDDYVYRCVLTAWDIVKGGDELGRLLKEKYGRTVSFGIGVNVGPAVVGNIGNDVRMDYTAIGDTVNTAARLESQARPGQVLLSKAAYEAVKDRVRAVYLGEIPLKGKSEGVEVYGLEHINEYEGIPPLKTASLPPGKDPVSYGK